MASKNDVTKKLPQQLTDLLLKIKRVTQESICVAEFAQVVEYDPTKSYSPYKCELICNPNIVVQAECLEGFDIDKGSRVLIVFCDSDFRPAMQRIRTGKPAPILQSNDLHSSSYACIVGKLA